MGDEDILGSRIEIIKNSQEFYTIIFEQEGFFPELFVNLKINGNIINNKNIIKKDNECITKSTIIIKFKAVLNPKPEDLFVLDNHSKKK